VYPASAQTGFTPDYFSAAFFGGAVGTPRPPRKKPKVDEPFVVRDTSGAFVAYFPARGLYASRTSGGVLSFRTSYSNTASAVYVSQPGFYRVVPSSAGPVVALRRLPAPPLSKG
jgi:hypothetical protein